MRYTTAAILAGLASFAIPTTASAQTHAEQCAALINAAEVRYNIPTGLLMAIALTESGGQNGPDPHAMNIAGMTYIAPNVERMAAVIQRGYNTGQTSIDVGCMQINLKYHAHNFSSPYELLNSRVNVDYGARYLAELANETKSWRDAVMTYHNRKSPSRRAWYGCKVWNNYLKVHRQGEGYAPCGQAKGSSTAATAPQPGPRNQPVAPQVATSARQPRAAAPAGPLTPPTNQPVRARAQGTIAIVGEGDELPEITQQDRTASAFTPIRPLDWSGRSNPSRQAEPDVTDPDYEFETRGGFGRVTRADPKN